MNRSFRSIEEMNESQYDGYYLNEMKEEENEVQTEEQMHACNLNEKGLEDPIDDRNRKDELSEREDGEMEGVDIDTDYDDTDEDDEADNIDDIDEGDDDIDVDDDEADDFNDFDDEGDNDDEADDFNDTDDDDFNDTEDDVDDVDDIDIDDTDEGDDSNDINDDDSSEQSEMHAIIDTSNDDETEDSDLNDIDIDTDYDDSDSFEISDSYNEDYNNVNNHLTTFHRGNVNENANELLYNFNLHSSPSNNQHKVFIAIANEIAKFSKCQSKQVGCIVVKDGRIISSGCNGTPTGAINCSELFTSARMNDPIYRETHHAFSEAMECHAEENAILMAARYGNSIDKSIFYVSMKPCERCLKMIANLNVKYIYYDKVYDKCVEYKDYVKDMIRDLDIHLIDINTMN